MKSIDRVYGRPYKNPNRWMVTEVPVQPDRRIDWLSVIGFLVVIASSPIVAMAVRTM